jgi:hypothetical protein
MNRAKPTMQIHLNAAENIIQAIGFSNQIGLPLNRFLTISWEHAQAVGRVHDNQGRFLERYMKWIRYYRSTGAYVWSIEQGRVWGYHSHVLIHVPLKLIGSFKKSVPNWINGDVDQSGHAKTFDIQKINAGYGIAQLNPLKGITRYLLKAANDEVSEILSIRREPQKAGIVVGKRVGTSQNIGRAARIKHSISKGANI